MLQITEARAGACALSPCVARAARVRYQSELNSVAGCRIVRSLSQQNKLKSIKPNSWSLPPPRDAETLPCLVVIPYDVRERGERRDVKKKCKHHDARRKVQTSPFQNKLFPFATILEDAKERRMLGKGNSGTQRNFAVDVCLVTIPSKFSLVSHMLTSNVTSSMVTFKRTSQLLEIKSYNSRCGATTLSNQKSYNP
ncbi:hypothetical protein BaRGS_00036564 [Batillaria attramentaria]|uniref:Uncharacterized protein n=1 Tax=Batillaria attramentaria TaxID=370345 RepID=A0ABD0JB33_9CAEN